MVEIEIRARVNRKAIKQKLESLGAAKKGEGWQQDTYYKCAFDKERKLVFRIRRKNGNTLLTLKGSSQHEDDVAWQEWEMPIHDSENLEKLFLTNDYVVVVDIQKERDSYTLDEYEINIDTIKGLGDFVEVELITEDVQKGQEQVANFLTKKLGIPEDEFVSKGYVPLMIENNSTEKA